MPRVRKRRLFVVVPGLQDPEVVPVDEVDEAVLLGDAARPGAGQGVSELLRFADAGEGVPAGVGDQAVDALEDVAVGRLPVGVVVPSRVG
jgi:hypothetical protein